MILIMFITWTSNEGSSVHQKLHCFLMLTMRLCQCAFVLSPLFWLFSRAPSCFPAEIKKKHWNKIQRHRVASKPGELTETKKFISYQKGAHLSLTPGAPQPWSSTTFHTEVQHGNSTWKDCVKKKSKFSLSFFYFQWFVRTDQWAPFKLLALILIITQRSKWLESL